MPPKTIVIQSEEEFKKRRCREMNIPLEHYERTFKVIPCDCLDKYCPGWWEKLQTNK